MSNGEETKDTTVKQEGNVKILEKKGRDNIFELFQRHLGHKLRINVPEFEALRPVSEVLDNYFECTKRGSRVRLEIVAGFVNFLSSMYCLPVLSDYMERAGYVKQHTFAIMTLCIGVGNIVSGLWSNLPLVICPPTAETIFLTNSLLSDSLDASHGNLAVVANGGAVLVLGLIPPLAKFVVRLIPNCIQIGTTVGIGLLTALAGSTDLGLVVSGKYDILKRGPITDQVIVGLLGVFIIACAFLAKSRNKYLYALLFGMVVWWSVHQWPAAWLAVPEFAMSTLPYGTSESTILSFSLIFLTILTVFGLSRSLCEMAAVIKPHESIPNARYLLITIALTNILSGLGFGPPFTLSPEGASGINLGCKTGLSSVSCGVFYLLSMFWGPFYFAIPLAATSPVLISVGLLLFMNVRRIDFDEPKFSYPAFVTLIFIPFTNSTFVGLVIGYTAYVMLSVVTLDVIDNVRDLYVDFFVKKTIFTVEGSLVNADQANNDTNHQESAVDILFDANNTGMNIEKISNPLVQGRKAQV